MRWFTSFLALNITQFLTALNDNLYKLLLIFFLISLKGEQASSMILALAGAIFVIPFLLFAAPAGILADRYSKQRIIFFSRIFEILVVSLAIIAFARESAPLGYIVLFLMATLSAFFSPCKYGILPELVKPEKLSHYNGILTATTYLAIILGTFIASFLTDITHKNYTLSVSICVIIASISFFTSLCIERTPVQAKNKKISLHFFPTLLATLKRAGRVRYLLAVILFGSYFLFMGAYVQLNIIPFTIESLHQTEIEGGYLFLLTAIGMGLGAFLAGRASHDEIELAFVPLAAFGITCAFSGLYFMQHNLYAIAPLLVLVGLLGGFYIVPIDAFIQVASPPQDRGQNVAASNLFNFTGVIIASGLIALFSKFLHMSAASGFFSVGILTFVIALALTVILADQLLRFVLARLIAPFWKLRVVGRKHLHPHEPSLLVANRVTWLDTLILMATLPRLMRYIIPTPSRPQGKNFYKDHLRAPLLHLLRLIPIDYAHLVEMNGQARKTIEKELSLGHSVCLMLPSDLTLSRRKEWQERVKELQEHFTAPLIASHIARNRTSKRGGLLRGDILVTFSKVGE